MQPNEQPQHPIDYLDSIATTPKGASQKSSDKLFFIVIAAGILVTLVVGGFMLLGGGPSSSEDLSRISVRLKNLQKVSDDSQKKIVSSKLRATNTSLSLVFTNANRDIAEHLTKSGVDTEKINPKITESEKTEELTKKIEDARLNAVFDRTYAREMTYQLDTLIILLKQTEARTGSKATKEFLATTRSNLEPLQKQFAGFDAA